MQQTPVDNEQDIATREIQRTLLDYLQTKRPRDLFFREFAAASARLDLLTVGESLRGYEIKSDFDSLRRVDSQLYSYAGYCEELTFVAGPRLALKLLSRLPIWCGVMLVYRANCQNTVVTLRKPAKNPRLDARNCLALLSAKELNVLLRQHYVTQALRKRLVIDLLADMLSQTEIREHVISSLKRRDAPPSDARPKLHGDSRQPEPTSLDFPSASLGWQ